MLADEYRLMNERVSHHRVVSGVPRDAQTLAPRSHASVQTLGCVISFFLPQRTRELESNGYQVTVSAEGVRLMSELVSHHRAVSGVPRDTQTSACRP